MTPRLLALVPWLGFRKKLLLAFAAFALLPLAAGGALGFVQVRRSIAEQTREHLGAHLDANAAHLGSTLDVVTSDIRLLAWSLQRRGLTGQLDDDERRDAGALLQTLVELREEYDQARILSKSGVELVRADRHEGRVRLVPGFRLQDKSDRYYVHGILQAPSTWLSPVDLNVEHGVVEVPHRLVLRVGRAIRSADGRTLALLVTNVRAEPILARLDALDLGPGVELLLVTGATVLSRHHDGTWELLPDDDPLRQRPWWTAATAGARAVLVPDGDHFVSFAAVPLASRGGDSGWRLIHRVPAALVEGPSATLLGSLIPIGLAAALLSIVFAAVAARSLARPLQDVLGFVRAVGDETPRPTLDIATADEIEHLARGVADMAASLDRAHARLLRWNAELQHEVDERVTELAAMHDARAELQEQVRRADRLSSLGLLSASLAHEMGNPLGAMKTLCQVTLREQELDDDATEVIELLLAEIDRLTAVLDKVRGLAKPAPAGSHTATPREVFSRVASLVERGARRAGVSLHIQGDALDQPLRAGEHQLEQVVLNLVMNSLQAMEGEGAIHLVAKTAGYGVDLMVQDNGPGIPAEARERVLEPFYTTKPDGTGLGLAIVADVARELGGRLRLAPGPGRGTIATVHLPTARDEDRP